MRVMINSSTTYFLLQEQSLMFRRVLKQLYHRFVESYINQEHILLRNVIFRHAYLSRGYIFKFTPHFICWKYFDEFFMGKNLLNIYKFTELNKRGNHTLLITLLTFLFSFHFQHIFSLSLANSLIYTCFRTIFLTQSQKNVL